MDFALWNRAAVMQLIERECAVKLHVRSVGKYLARWGITPPKPIRRAYEQRPEAVEVWLNEQYSEVEKFLEALIKDGKKKVFLSLDNFRVHHGKPVKAWVAARQDKIELFYFLSYSPELNPEKRLNGDLKQVIGAKVPAHTKAKLKSAAIEHMTELENDPARIKSYFPDPCVKYATGQ